MIKKIINVIKFNHSCNNINIEIIGTYLDAYVSLTIQTITA